MDLFKKARDLLQEFKGNNYVYGAGTLDRMGSVTAAVGKKVVFLRDAFPGSEAFIAYAILLSLLVGLFQFLLGVLRLGMVVNFLSHPVVNGFTNAAAIIIATSQLPKLFGVDVDKAEHHYETVYRTILAAWRHTKFHDQFIYHQYRNRLCQSEFGAKTGLVKSGVMVHAGWIFCLQRFC